MLNEKMRNGTQSVEADDNGAYLIANRSSHELPKTGGAGTILYTAGGLGLILAAGMGFVYCRRKQIQDGRRE